MAVWGRVLNGSVVETTDANPTNKYPPSFVWVELPDYALSLGYSSFSVDDNGNVVFSNMREYRDIVKDIVADKRWKFQETYYIEYKDNRYSTDRESCNTLTSAISLGSLVESSQKGVTFKTPWKTLTGFTVLELKDLITIAILLGQFVNDIFAIENNYDVSIDSEEDTKKIYDLVQDVSFVDDYKKLKEKV